MKFCFAALLFFLLPYLMLASNTISVGDYQVDANNEIKIEVFISNDSEFSAFQFDLKIPEHYSLNSNSVKLAGRENGHELSWELLNNSLLRVLSYSSTGNSFSGSDGSVLEFKLTAGVLPGTEVLALSNVIIAQNGANIINQISNGSLTLLAPSIKISPESIEFEKVPLSQQQSKTISIQNVGNLPLEVSKLSISTNNYTLDDSTGFVLNANSSINRTLYFFATTKGRKSGQITIQSNCPSNPKAIIQLVAQAYAVNELLLDNISGSTDQIVTLPIFINNNISNIFIPLFLIFIFIQSP